MANYLIKEYNKRWLRLLLSIVLSLTLLGFLLYLGIISIVFSNGFGKTLQGLFFIAMSLLLFYGGYAIFSDGFKQYKQQKDYFWDNYLTVAEDLEKSCNAYHERSSAIMLSEKYIVLLTKEAISDIYFIERDQVESLTVRDISLGRARHHIPAFTVAFKLPIESERAIITLQKPELVKAFLLQLKKDDLLIFNHSTNKFDLPPKFKGNHLIY